MPEIKGKESIDNVENTNAPFSEIKPKTDITVDEAQEELSKPFKHSNIETIDGEKYRVDDNGNPYAKYYKETKTYELLPNTKYTMNGYNYETNEHGQLIKATAEPLRKTDRDARKSINETLQDMNAEDEKGHIIGDQFDGTNDVGNLVAMDGALNKGKYKDMEMTLAKAVDAGYDVKMEVNLNYSDNNTKRPDAMTVTYSINGLKFTKVFYNTPDGGAN